jgi:hypothetical protein
MQFPYKNKIDKFLVEICRFTGVMTGFAPLAARPAPTLSTSSFAFLLLLNHSAVGKALTPVRGSHPQILSKIRNSNQKREHRFGVLFFGADDRI